MAFRRPCRPGHLGSRCLPAMRSSTPCTRLMSPAVYLQVTQDPAAGWHPPSLPGPASASLIVPCVHAVHRGAAVSLFAPLAGPGCLLLVRLACGGRSGTPARPPARCSACCRSCRCTQGTQRRGEQKLCGQQVNDLDEHHRCIRRESKEPLLALQGVIQGRPQPEGSACCPCRAGMAAQHSMRAWQNRLEALTLTRQEETLPAGPRAGHQPWLEERVKGRRSKPTAACRPCMALTPRGRAPPAGRARAAESPG